MSVAQAVIGRNIKMLSNSGQYIDRFIIDTFIQLHTQTVTSLISTKYVDSVLSTAVSKFTRYFVGYGRHLLSADRAVVLTKVSPVPSSCTDRRTRKGSRFNHSPEVKLGLRLLVKGLGRILVKGPGVKYAKAPGKYTCQGSKSMTGNGQPITSGLCTRYMDETDEVDVHYVIFYFPLSYD
jgi:hypothetical protein